jgi:hypothetical protein
MPSLLEENYPFQEKYKKIHLNKAFISQMSLLHDEFWVW